MTSTIPSANLDWFRYGGIHRPVWVEEIRGPGYVSSLQLTPVSEENKDTLRFRAELVNVSDSPLENSWTLYVQDQPVMSKEVRLAAGETRVIMFAKEMAEVRRWSPDQPQLYSVRLAFAGDDLIDRVGFREVRVSGHQILLNGQPLRIRGVNRHEDHPEWGFALPPHLMLRDLDVLKKMGANAIRGAHYPNDQRMLDLCDEQGILFLEEIPLWGFTKEQMILDIIQSRATAMLWAMIKRDINHPCIWAWSVLYECATDTPEGRMVTKDLIDTAREADPTRLVTFASWKNFEDQCFDLVDVVCVNRLLGWYERHVTWSEFLDHMRTKIGDKPLIVSVFGGGGILGYRTLEDDVYWSEEYQQRVLHDALAVFLAREDLMGFYVWQLMDTRADQRTEHVMRRPRAMNNKGLLDEYRRPKLAYYAFRDAVARANEE
jgi:beta-glucuronidase